MAVLRWTAVAVALVAVLVYVLASKVAVIDPEFYWLPPLPSLEVNRRLVGAEHLFEGQWVGPEALTLDPTGKWLYTGLLDGRIVRWDGSSLTYEEVARTGDKLPNCGEREVEHICGRPLGLHFDRNGDLIVADAYKGLLSVSPEGKVTTLLTTVEGRAIAFANDLAIDEKDGTIYLTDSSTFQRRDFMLDVLESRPKGRLIAYYPSNKTAKVILNNLYFPNGITWHADKQSLLFSELTRFRVMRLYPKTGKVETFIDNLFGSPDNIRPRKVGGATHYLIGLGLKRSQPNSLIQLIAPVPVIRSLVSLFPSFVVIGTLPPYGLIAEFTETGEPVETYQDPTGATAWLSEALEWNGYMYLASFRNPFLGRIKI